MENKMISEQSENLPLHPYQVEVQKIKDNCGDLDQIRIKLGMNQRQICKLLLVDPSAWTRWIKTDAPPHIYQALRWLLELKKTNPEAAGPVNLHTRVEKVEGLFAIKVQTLENKISHIENLFETLVGIQNDLHAHHQNHAERIPADGISEEKIIDILNKHTKNMASAISDRKTLKLQKKRTIRKKASKAKESVKSHNRKKRPKRSILRTIKAQTARGKSPRRSLKKTRKKQRQKTRARRGA